MNREEIIRMAREAGLIYDEECTSPWVEDTNLTPFLERFATLAASAEREACAELCEMLDVENPKGKSWDEGTIDCANAIRARGDA